MKPSGSLHPRGGFTLVEVAVTLIIVGIGLTLCLQSLFTAKTAAFQTRNMKLARELGVQTLGQIESGLFQEEIQSGYSGSYAEEGYPEFFFEICLGDESFLEYEGEYDEQGPYFDTFAARRDREYEAERDSDEDEDEIEEIYEKVRIRVTFTKAGEYTPYLDLERWMPWTQVYGEDEEAEEEALGE